MEVYVFFDVLILFICFTILKVNCKLSFYHPATWLLLYHFVTNSLRFLAVANGADLAFSNFAGIQGASIEELMRAIFWADISLLVSSFFIISAEKFQKKGSFLIKETAANPKFVKYILVFTIPLGIWGALTQLAIPTITLESQNTTAGSSYFTLIQSWFGLSMLILIYLDGFKKKYIILLILYLVLISIQGYHRYRLVFPIVFLITTYLSQNNFNWPTRKQIIILLALAVIFNPLKSIGRIIQSGGGVEEVWQNIIYSFADTSKGNSGDQSFLDQYAMTLTEIDKHGKLYLGATVLPILVSPIPRLLWPSKPKLNEWQEDISTSSRPFTTIGSVATIYGESYANFGYLGIVILPGLLFYLLTRWYNRMLLISKRSIEFLFYILIISSLVQVLRDGFISLFLFPVVNSMPIFLVFIIHKLFYKPKIKIVKNGSIIRIA